MDCRKGFHKSIKLIEELRQKGRSNHWTRPSRNWWEYNGPSLRRGTSQEIILVRFSTLLTAETVLIILWTWASFLRQNNRKRRQTGETWNKLKHIYCRSTSHGNFTIYKMREDLHRYYTRTLKLGNWILFLVATATREDFDHCQSVSKSVSHWPLMEAI